MQKKDNNNIKTYEPIPIFMLVCKTPTDLIQSRWRRIEKKESSKVFF